MAKPKRRQEAKQPPDPERRKWLILAAVGIAIAIVLVFVTTRNAEDGGAGDAGQTATSQQQAAPGLPDTPDYHSLIVSPNDPDKIFLGTHEGLFASSDGGKSWRQTGAIEGDAMSLARDATDDQLLYAAGHGLFQRSEDGGATWNDIPLDDAISETSSIDGAKAVDIHGFAADPAQPGTVYAAVANRGLYRSTDYGESFTKLSDTGAAAMGVALTDTKPQRIYLADMGEGLLVSSNEGKTWRLLQPGVISVAISPDDPKRVLAAGEAIYLATDGESFKQVQAGPKDGFGPVVFAPSDPLRAYAVAYDRVLYVSQDGGATWRVA